MTINLVMNTTIVVYNYNYNYTYTKYRLFNNVYNVFQRYNNMDLKYY